MKQTYFISMVSLIKRTLVLLVMYLYFAPDIPAESHVVNNVDLFEPGQQSIEATKKADMQPFFRPGDEQYGPQFSRLGSLFVLKNSFLFL